jgi:hypothetical protein
MFLFKILNYATHAKCRGTPGDYSDQARHQSQPSATSATPAKVENQNLNTPMVFPTESH